MHMTKDSAMATVHLPYLEYFECSIAFKLKRSLDGRKKSRKLHGRSSDLVDTCKGRDSFISMQSTGILIRHGFAFLLQREAC